MPAFIQVILVIENKIPFHAKYSTEMGDLKVFEFYCVFRSVPVHMYASRSHESIIFIIIIWFVQFIQKDNYSPRELINKIWDRVQASFVHLILFLCFRLPLVIPIPVNFFWTIEAG